MPALERIVLPHDPTLDFEEPRNKEEMQLKTSKREVALEVRAVTSGAEHRQLLWNPQEQSWLFRKNSKSWVRLAPETGE